MITNILSPGLRQGPASPPLDTISLLLSLLSHLMEWLCGDNTAILRNKSETLHKVFNFLLQTDEILALAPNREGPNVNRHD